MADEAEDWQILKGTWSEQNLHLLDNSLWTDCEFVVGKTEAEQQRFLCHRLLLGRASPVFAAMLHGGLAEEGAVRVTDLDPPVFSALLRFVYTATVELPTSELAAGLCYASNKYMMPRLRAACLAHLDYHVVPENACQVFELAKLMQCRELEDKCFKMIRERTKEVIKFPSFYEIQQATLLEIVRQDSLTLYSEAHLIRASFRWAAAQVNRENLPNTGPSLRDVLGLTLFQLRFLALTAKEFADGPAQSDILTPDEKVAFFTKISSISTEIQVPDEFCCLRERSRPSIAVPRFQFDSEHHTLSSYEIGGRDKSTELLCHVSFLVNAPVLLSGVELLAQERPSYAGATYWEAVDVTLQDTTYDLLALAKFRGLTPYEKHFDVKLSEPLKLEPDRKYNLSVIFCIEGYYRKGKGVTKITNQNVFLYESRVAISNSSTFIRSLIYTKI